MRNFVLAVYRVKDGSEVFCGSLTHGVYNPPCGAGTEATWLKVDWEREHVKISRTFFDRNGNEQGPTIGQVPRDQW